jgi:hypothetical protein
MKSLCALRVFALKIFFFPQISGLRFRHPCGEADVSPFNFLFKTLFEKF